MSGCFVKIKSEEAAWASAEESKVATPVTVRA
jgi:hypothetical protein